MTEESSNLDERAGAAVTAYLAGDLDALHDLVDLLRPFLMGAALGVLRDRVAAEDVFVEAITEVVRRLPDLREPRAVVAYARRTARSRAVDQLRKRDRRDSHLALLGTSDLAGREPNRSTLPIERIAAATSPETRALSSERVAHIHELIAGLPEPGQALLRAVLLDGEQIGDVAARLHLSRSTAYRALRRARAILAARLSGIELPGATS